MIARTLRTLALCALPLLVACPGGEAPTIVSFVATPTSVLEGGKTTLEWNVTGADSITITAAPGGEVIATANAMSNVQSAAITENTTFTLTASNGDGDSSATVTVLVNKDNTNPPTIDSFTATPEMVASGGAVVLAWQTTNATSVDITPNVVTGGDPDGQITVSPIATTTFTLTAKNADASATREVTVTIIGPQIVTFTASPQAITLGDSTMLSWNVTDATNVTITDDAGNEVFNDATLVGQTSVTPAVANPPGSIIYTLTAVDAENRTATDTVTVNVNPPQAPSIIAFDANPSTINLGDSSDLTWVVADALTIEIQANGTTATITTDLAGTFTVSPTIDIDYTLIATNAFGSSQATATVLVDNGAPLINDFAANPNPVALGSNTTLSWDTVAADSLRISNGTTEIYSTTDATGTFDVTPTATSTVYTLEATNTIGTNTFNVTVYAHAAPVINDFTVTPLSFTGNSTVATITWDVTSAATIDLLADGVPVAGFTAIDVNPMTTDSAGSIMVTVPTTTTFSLVAESAGGIELAEVTVINVFNKTEPNDTPDLAVTHPGDGSGAAGTINPARDVDWFVVNVPAGGNLFAETSDGRGGCTLDTIVAVFNSTIAGSVAIATNDDIGGGNVCSRVGPFAGRGGTRDPDLANMAAGPYYIRVTAFDPTDTGSYVLTAVAVAAACGNTLIEGAEQCDDGNTAAGDGCSATCTTEVAGMVMGPAAPGTPPTTFTGAIVPAIDRDVYEVTMQAAGYISAETFTTALGQCTVNTVLTLLDANFAVLGSDDNDGVNNCSVINPNFDAFAFVQAGTYYLQVEEQNNDAEIPSYGIAINTVAQGCGNAILETQAPFLEVCDDGNAINGDGCSMTCVFEGVAETEPNNVYNDTGVLTATQDTVFSGAITPAGEYDFYAITVPDGYHVDATVTVGSFNSCPETPEARVRLYDTDGINILASNDNAGPGGNCGRVYPGNDVDTTNLAAGTYFLRVSEDNIPAFEIPSYYLHVRLIAPGCGNDVLDASLSEQCDDGNLTNGDGCSSTCTYEVNATIIQPPGGTVTIDLPAQDNFQLIQVNITLAGQSIAAVAADVGGTTCNTADTGMALGDSNFVALGSKVSGGPTGTAGNCAAILFPADAFARNLAVGTYYVAVGNQGTTGGMVQVDIQVIDATCGDTVVNTGEQCDDGNATGGDGCGATCQIEPIGNAMLPTATPISQAEAINPIGQHDFFRITVTSTVYLRAETFAPDQATGCNTGNDTLIALNDANFARLGTDDDDGVGACSLINEFDAFSILAPGTYFLEVFDFGNDSVIAAYELVMSSVDYNVCGNNVLEASNNEQCDDGNTNPGDGCSALCTNEGVFVPEVEANDTPQTANTLGVLAVGITDVSGSINPVGDRDWFTFTTLVPTNALIGTFGGGQFNVACGGDTELTLYDAVPTDVNTTNANVEPTIVAYDDDDGADVPGQGACSLINGTQANPQRIALAAGTYYIQIREFGNNSAIAASNLRIDLQ
jgi:cysteine-rich repeat protein